MKYVYEFEEKVFVVEKEEEVIELNQVNAWFEEFENIADVLEREDICFPFDEVIREDRELEHMVLKTNKKCNITNKYVSRIALKEFMDIQYP